MKRISNRDGSQYTSKLEEFKGNNTFARWEKTACYVVYSLYLLSCTGYCYCILIYMYM